MDDCELRPVTTAGDWADYHRIRRTLLFEARGRVGVYREDHADEFEEWANPMVLVAEDQVIGTVRIDLHGPHAILRLVAIDTPFQRRGFGSRLEALAERFAAEHGALEVIVNAAPEATGFYQKMGYGFAPPDESPGHPRMKKGLTSPPDGPI